MHQPLTFLTDKLVLLPFNAMSNMNLHLYQKVKEALVQERVRLFNLLKEVPFLNPFPSYSNFILCEVASGTDAKKLKVRNFLTYIITLPC